MESSASNTWVESYLDALLNAGLSTEYQSKPNANATPDTVDADKALFAKYYVHQILQMDEDALRAAWNKATSTSYGRRERDVRLEYLSWRVWFMKRKHEAVRATQHDHFELSSTGSESRDISDDEDDETVSPTRAERQPTSPTASTTSSLSAAPTTADVPASEPPLKRPSKLRVTFEDIPEEEPSTIDIFNIQRVQGLYIVLISMHGLVRGTHMELGRDPDTGGQVKYVVELASALALLPGVYRVELLTRQILDPSVDASYGVPVERLGAAEGKGALEGAFIVRLPCGPPHEYLRKEALWPYVREFADRAISHIDGMLQQLRANMTPCELYAVHGHYADAGEAAALISSTMDADMLMTGHSLGRNKLEHLRASGTMTRSEIESTYQISRRIEGEERALDTAMVTFTSTQQEIDQQWGLYDGYEADPTPNTASSLHAPLQRWGLARILRTRMQAGRAMPLMRVIPPGLDFSSLKAELPEDPVLKVLRERKAAAMGSVPGSFLNLAGLVSPTSQPTTPAAGRSDAGSDDAFETPHEDASHTAVREEEPPIWKEAFRFLRHPYKPAILAMSRPDAKKNITTLVKAFASSEALRNNANLVLIMGNRDNIDSMAPGSAKVLTQVLKLIDVYDLYGSVAYPKHHSQSEVSDIYMLAARTRGIFTNVALQEPFGLTVIEAAAHGVPTVATCNGGPVDIMKTLHHGVVVDPTNPDAIAAELVRIVTTPELWDAMSNAGRTNIMAYSWPSHCVKYLETVEAEKQRAALCRRHHFSHSNCWDAESLGIRSAAGAPSRPEFQPSRSSFDGSGLPFVEGKAPAFEQSAATVPGMLDDGAAGVSPTSSGFNMYKTASNMSNDDLAVTHEPQVTTTLSGISGSGGPLARRRERFIVVQLDGSFATNATGRLLEDLMDAILEIGNSGQRVGLGVLSMLGFDDTRDLLVETEVPMSKVDFIVCNSGADIWFNHGSAPGGECVWEADVSYEQHIQFRWDRNAIARTLNKWASTPSPKLPIKALMRNLREEEKGLHPHHLTMELDATTRQVLLCSMSGQSSQRRINTAGSAAVSQAYASYPPTILLERLRKRLRRFGFRVSLTLQMLPQGSQTLVVLHVTPMRATRALALRFILRSLGRPMDNMALLACPRKIREVEEGGLVLSAFTSDFGELLTGWQQVTVLTPMARLLYNNARSISMEYREPEMEGDAGDDGLAPIEKLTTTLQAYDLQSRVVVAKEVGSMVKRVVDGIDDPMAGLPQYPGPAAK